MARQSWTYMLRIMRRNPARFPMDRLGEYISQFAELLGAENKPVFKGIRKASTGIKAELPSDRWNNAHARIVQAKSDPKSRPGKILQSIESMLGADAIPEAQLLDASEKVIYLFKSHVQETEESERIYQQSSVDGIVTGIVGADDTMHLHIRDHFDRDLRLVIRDEELARELLMQFRKGVVRLYVAGTWIRSDLGWVPETSKCTVSSFEVLDDTPVREVFAAIAAIAGNGWQTLDDPVGEWMSLRGLH